MKKYLYNYDNDDWKLHSTFISKKTIQKEGKNSSCVYIYEVDPNSCEFERFVVDNDFLTGKYVTALLLD